MNRPAFPQGSLTAEDARWIRQEDAVEAARIKTVEPNYYRDLLDAKNARMKRKAKVVDWLLASAGAVVMGVLALVVAPVIMAGYGL